MVPADEPVVRADDRGVLRGDGLFETMHVRAGRPWLVREHLARLARSAAVLELPLPRADELRDLLDTACAGWPAGTEGALRLVCTRGPEGAPDRPSTPPSPGCRPRPGRPGGTASGWRPCRWGSPPTPAPTGRGCSAGSRPRRTG
ncbi:hypothetical protein GCM10027615_19970 [Plantactinospora veratri]